MLVVLFEVAGRMFAIRQCEVQEIVQLPELIQVDETPSAIAGFLNLRSAIVPVVRLGKMFGFDVTVRLESPLIVLRPHPRTVAWLVDRAVGTLEASTDRIRALHPGDSFHGVAEAAIQLDPGTAVLISAHKMLLEGERQALAALECRNVERLLQWRVVR